MLRTCTGPSRHCVFLTLFFLAFTAASTHVCFAESITVELADGRTIVGEVDAKTDRESLWLRRETPGIQLSSSVAWNHVRTLRRGTRAIAASDWLKEIEPLKTAGKSFRKMVPAVAGVTAGASEPLAARSPPAVPRIQSLHIEAHVARWGRDTASDGVEVLVFPLSAAGELVPVDGQLDLALFGEFTNARGGEQTVLSPRFSELERSSKLVRRGDFANGPARYQLKFERTHPDVDYDLARNAVVHARLGIAGQGVFEASAACVPLREFSPIRDQLQLYTPQRFFPGENVYLRPHESFP